MGRAAKGSAAAVWTALGSPLAGYRDVPNSEASVSADRATEKGEPYERGRSSETKPATEGMKGRGYYDAHSEYQREVAQTGLHLLESSVADIGTKQGFTIIDYGCGTGANSAAAFRAAIDAYRKLDREALVICVYVDLPTNDWNSLFSDVIAAQESGTSQGGSVIPMAVASDFFSPCVAPASGHVGMSFNSAHWLSSQPTLLTPGTLYFDRARGDARRALAEAAALDWTDFLRARASDIAPGGRLLVQCIGSIPDPDAPDGVRASAGRLLDLMQEVAETLVGQGLLSQAALDRFVLPVYARTVEEAVRPLSAGPVADAFEVLVAETAPVPSPYEGSYRDNGDARGYASAYGDFVRGFSESSLQIGLFQPGAVGIAAADLCDRYFEELEQRLQDSPGTHAFDDWTLTVLLRRRD